MPLPRLRLLELGPPCSVLAAALPLLAAGFPPLPCCALLCDGLADSLSLTWSANDTPLLVSLKIFLRVAESCTGRGCIPNPVKASCAINGEVQRYLALAFAGSAALLVPLLQQRHISALM